MFLRRIGALVFAFSLMLLPGCGSGIPNLAGTWTFTGTSSNTPGFQRFTGTGTLIQTGGNVEGTIGNEYTLIGSALRGGGVNFTLTATCSVSAGASGTITIYLTGKAQSNSSMSGSYVESDDCFADSGSWTAAKQ